MLHIPLAAWAQTSEIFSTYYALIIFFIGALAALAGKTILTACIISYIVGAEVLFRMTGANVFWEFGKYSIAAIIILYLFSGKRRTKSRRSAGAPLLLLYFLLLMPAVWLTNFPEITDWLNQVSFNMSGHLVLCMCGLFFSRLTLNREEFRKIFISLAAPVVCISFITLYDLLTTRVKIWGMSSTKMTSGHFGPNQVSSILGFTAFLCIVYFILSKKRLVLKNIFLGFSVLLTIQALLTFSRGGVLGAVAASVLFLVAITKSKKNRVIGFCLGLFFISITHYFIMPALDKYTEGFITLRYGMREKVGEVEVFETGHRVDFMESDLAIFKKHLLTGIGISKAMEVRLDEWGKPVSSHTEWTRVLAEHGLLGLFSMIFLWMWILSRFISAKDPVSKAIILSFAAYAVIYMSHAGMRLVIPAFAIGFLGANFEFEEA